MKIVLGLASRERPAATIGVIMAAHRLRSTKHELEFVIGLDEDDKTASLIAEAFEGECAPVFSVGPPPIVRGEVENRIMKIAQGLNADAVTLISDRVFIITPAWDEWLARAIEFEPLRVKFWQCPEDPGCIIPIAPKAYLDAIDWKWDQEIHPFWFSDTYHQEIDLMIHGGKSRKARCTYSGARGVTANGRDFAFWLNVFSKTRVRRRALAAKIADRLKVPLANDPNVEAYFAGYDQVMVERCAGFEERFGDKREPTERYNIAKLTAEHLLEEIAQ